MCRANPERVLCLRGNHEQMLLDFIEGTTNLWITPVTGGERTFEQYVGESRRLKTNRTWRRRAVKSRKRFRQHILISFVSDPTTMKTSLRSTCTPGLDHGKHPRDSSPQLLIWSRDMDFYKNYRGKPCVFGHTPTPFCRCGAESDVTAFTSSTARLASTQATTISRRSVALSLPDFTLYQAFADGHEETHQITSFIPETLKEMRKKAGIGR